MSTQEFIEPITTKDRKRGHIMSLLCFVYINTNFKQPHIFKQFCWNDIKTISKQFFIPKGNQKSYIDK